jgi:hypothetical protein
LTTVDGLPPLIKRLVCVSASFCRQFAGDLGVPEKLERVTGIEPVILAWEASLIPFQHTRVTAVIMLHAVVSKATGD